MVHSSNRARPLSRVSLRILTLPTTSRGGCKSEQRFADSTSHFALAGRPTKAPFVMVYEPEGSDNDLGGRRRSGCRDETLPTGAQSQVLW